MTTQTATPPPSIEATRKAITDRVIRECIALYHRARRDYDAFIAAQADDPALDCMLEVTSDRRGDAETNLIRAILGPFRPPGRRRPEKHLDKPRGVRCDGRLYLVSPIDKDDAELLPLGGEASHGEDVMGLTVIDLTDVADAGTLANDLAYHPDGSRIYHVDDPDADDYDDEDDDEDRVEERDAEPVAPATTPRPGRVERPLLPLVRTTMTINSASEPGYLTSIEVAVYDQCLEGQAGSSQEGPAELREAGWMTHSMGPMTIAFRTVC